jgi:enterochelin esterase family protein
VFKLLSRLSLLLAAGPLLAAGETPFQRVLDMARQRPQPPRFYDALVSLLGKKEVRQGTAVMGAGPDFIWAVDSTAAPTLVIDDAPPIAMVRVRDADTWFYAGPLKTGVSHFYYYVINGAPFGGLNDIPAYLPESYEIPGVPHGSLSPKMFHSSRIYPGMETNYWIYVPAQYAPKAPAALMVWQDGETHVDRNGPARTLNVIDNLIQQRKIPVMIHVFVSPGAVGDQHMRSLEYDTVDDTYARFLRDELLPEVGRRYEIRQDSYSRAIAGNSSGGVCSFTAAWFHPELFSRVLSRIGSFTSIQWRSGAMDGGNDLPFKVRKEPKRNLRVWLQDGYNDAENEHGSWPLQNLQMANSLKLRGYDFHLSFGSGTHNPAHGDAEAPLELAWLWRDYDPAKTTQVFEMEEGEKTKPFFRVKIDGR